MENHYLHFSKNLYYNDSYYFHKCAFQVYKNNFNDKTHGFFSRTINEYLYTGKIRDMSTDEIRNFSTLNSTTLPTGKQLEVFTQNIIRLMDQSLHQLCPPTNFHFIAYRYETREKNDIVSNLVAGDYYHSRGYMSTSISPYNYYDRFDQINKTTKNVILMILLLPEKTRGYYIQNPHIFLSPPNYEYDRNHITAIEEYEYLIPRNSIWKLEQRMDLADASNIVYVMSLQHQMKPIEFYDMENYDKVKMTEEEVKKYVLSDSLKRRKTRQTIPREDHLRTPDISQFQSDIQFKLQLIQQKQYFENREDPIKEASKDLKFFLRIRLPYTKNLEVEKLQTKYASYFRRHQSYSIKDQSVMLFISPHMKNLYKFYSVLKKRRTSASASASANKNKSNDIIPCDLPFYCYLNPEYYSYEFHKFFQYFTYLFKCFDHCNFEHNTSVRDIINHMYMVDNNKPIFIIIQLNAKKNIHIYPTTNSEGLLLRQKYSIRPNYIKKIPITDQYHFSIMNVDAE